METGQVKWFNGKAGFGFVQVGELDVFVHHSGLKVRSDQFRYLVEGEYVELKVSKTGEKYQGTEVTGIKGGKLMCEVRSETRNKEETRPERRQETRPERREETRQETRQERKPREERKPRVVGVRKETVVEQMVHKPKIELL